jgi:triosephosphate isomerase
MANLVVANWKLNPQTVEDARTLASQVELGTVGIDRGKVETVICPPFVFLPVLQHHTYFLRLGVQTISAEAAGPFTGEISAVQVREFRVTHAIIGHSERRALGEDDELINRKVKVALQNKLQPILCVGWGTKKTSSLTAIKSVVERQLRAGLSGLALKKAKVVIAYEPVWAISKGLGNGKAVTPEHASEVIGRIHSLLPKAKVIYGGSLDGRNAPAFAAKKAIQGGLVGGASLRAADFLQIVKSFSL